MKRSDYPARGGQTVALHSDDNRIFVVLTFTYLASNNGTAFARNHRSSPVNVELSIERSGQEKEVLVNVEAGRASSSAEASKVARAYIREHGLRARQRQLARELIGS